MTNSIPKGKGIQLVKKPGVNGMKKVAGNIKSGPGTRQPLLPLLPFGPDGVRSAAATRLDVKLNRVWDFVNHEIERYIILQHLKTGKSHAYRASSLRAETWPMPCFFSQNEGNVMRMENLYTFIQ